MRIIGFLQQGHSGAGKGAAISGLGLTQEEEVLAELVFGECLRIALEMFGEFAEIAHILLARGRTIIFEIDVLLEFSKKRIVTVYHAPRGCPRVRASERQKSRDESRRRSLLPRSGSVQHGAGANADGRARFAESVREFLCFWAAWLSFAALGVTRHSS